MPFNADKFLGAALVPRTKTIPVPDLAEWFDGPAEWTVKGLSGHELGRCNEAKERSKNIAAALEAISSATHRDKVRGVTDALGLGDDTPADVVKRLEMLCLGSIDPVCGLPLAVKLCRTFPGEFYELTNHIVALTGAGHEPGKLSASGATPASEAP